MTVKTKYMIPALMLVILAGCNKEQAPVQEPSVPQKGTFTFSSSTGAGSKVTLNPDNSLFWAAGDKIAVYDCKAGTVYAKDVAVLTGGEGTGVGTFTPSALTENTCWFNGEDAGNQAYDFYAFYPGDSEAADPRRIPQSSGRCRTARMQIRSAQGTRKSPHSAGLCRCTRLH